MFPIHERSEFVKNRSHNHCLELISIIANPSKLLKVRVSSPNRGFQCRIDIDKLLAIKFSNLLEIHRYRSKIEDDKMILAMRSWIGPSVFPITASIWDTLKPFSFNLSKGVMSAGEETGNLKMLIVVMVFGLINTHGN